MSYTDIFAIKELKNKKVLFLDFETTGLPKYKRNFNLPPEEEYPSYKNNDIYDTSRILQIAWCYDENFNFKTKTVNSILRKPKDFDSVSKESEEIHHISYDMVRKNGVKLSTILNSDFGNAILNCDFIVGYNVFFDVNILLNELYRLQFCDTIKYIKSLKNNNKILCVGQLARQYCKPVEWRQYSPYQIPKQCDVYKYCFDEEQPNQHDAKGDVIAMIKILNYIIEYDEDILDNKLKLPTEIINEIGTNAKIDMEKYKGFIYEYNNIPLLKFSVHEKQSSIYVINLKTLKPTMNSNIKTELHNDTIKKIKKLSL